MVLHMSRQTTGFIVLPWSAFCLFWGIFGWLGSARDWFHNKQRVSPFYHQHLNLTQALEVSLSVRSSLSRVSLSLDVAVVGEEDELEEDVEQ